MKFQREEFLEELLKLSPSNPDEKSSKGEIFSGEKWIWIEKFLVPLNHLAAILKISDEDEFSIYQGKKGIAIRIGKAFKIYFSQMNAIEEERKEIIFSLSGKELSRIKKFLRFIKPGKDERASFPFCIKFEKGIFTLLSHSAILQGKTSIQENIVLSRDIFKRVKKGVKEIPIYKEDIREIAFPEHGNFIQEAKTENIFSCFVDIPKEWKGNCWIDFEKKSLSQKDEITGFEEERKDSVVASFSKGKLGINLDQIPLRGKLELKISQSGKRCFSLESEDFLLVSAPLNSGSEIFEKEEKKEEEREEKAKIVKVGNRFFEEKTAYCFIFDLKGRKQAGSIFKKVSYVREERDFFFWNGRKYDKFSGKEFLEGYDLAALRRNFLEIYGKSPKYRAFSLIP